MSETKEQKAKAGFFKNVKAEFQRIVWPGKRSVAKQTGLVIVTVIVMGVLLKLMDTGIGFLVSLIA